jgi:hypothetical protein
MSFKHGYQAGRVVGEHYLDYLMGFQIGFWIGVPLAIMKQMYSQPTLVNHTGHRNSARDNAIRIPSDEWAQMK